MTPAEHRRRVLDLLSEVHDLVQQAPSVDGISDAVLKLGNAVGELAVLSAQHDPPPPVQLYRCSSPTCPGYPYKASDFAHPASTCGQSGTLKLPLPVGSCSRCGSPHHWAADCPDAPASVPSPLQQLADDREQRIRRALACITCFELGATAWKTELRAILLGKDEETG